MRIHELFEGVKPSGILWGDYRNGGRQISYIPVHSTFWELIEEACSLTVLGHSLGEI